MKTVVVKLETKLESLKKNENVKNYILDLRNNPGGLLSQAIKITDFFIDSGEIVSTKSKRKYESRKFFAKKGDILDGNTIVVLINYGSASASEIVAGALKDHKRAIIIGENSYGKGLYHSYFLLLLLPFCGPLVHLLQFQRRKQNHNLLKQQLCFHPICHLFLQRIFYFHIFFCFLLKQFLHYL